MDVVTETERDRPRSRAVLAGWALVAVLALLGGCTGAPVVETRSRLVASWSEATDDWVAEVASGAGSTVLVTTDAERDAWIDGLPDAVEPDEVARVEHVDLAEELLVIGGYPRCMEHSRVEVDGETGEVRFVVYVPHEDEGTVCGWSPMTIDVWAVPLEELGGRDPVLVED